jgi:hypothetical protein
MKYARDMWADKLGKDSRSIPSSWRPGVLFVNIILQMKMSKSSVQHLNMSNNSNMQC